MTDTASPLNSGLYHLHKFFYIAFFIVAGGLIVLGVLLFPRGEQGVFAITISIPFLTLGAAHFYAAKGAHAGKGYGKILSRIIGTLWLFGFPIGTILGFYAWSKTGNKWQESTDTAVLDFDSDGHMVPPWIKYPGLSPYSMAWQTGMREAYRHRFSVWWKEQPDQIRARVGQKYAEPSGWGAFYEKQA